MHDTRGSGGFGPAPITLFDVKSYVELFGSPPVDLELFVRIMKMCDEVAIRHMSKRLKTDTKGAT